MWFHVIIKITFLYLFSRHFKSIQIGCFWIKLFFVTSSMKQPMLKSVYGTRNSTQLTINNLQIENGDNFTHLGSVITESRGTDDDIRMRIKKLNKHLACSTSFEGLQIFVNKCRRRIVHIFWPKGDRDWKGPGSVDGSAKHFVKNTLYCKDLP